MKKTVVSAVLFASLLVTSGMAFAAGETSSGTLTVDATLASTINLTFVTDASGVALTGSGTNAATLDFGTVSQTGSLAANVTRTPGTGNMVISTPFDVSVTKSNLTSATYALTAQLGTADAVNTWVIDTFTLNATTPASLTVTGAYATNAAHTLGLTIPNIELAGVITDTINFVATAN
jgi:hypothetical protein